MLYEVAELATLTSPAYLERLNKPSAWTARVMPHYRDMSRGFCAVAGSFGLGMGHVSVLIRFKPESDSAVSLRRWLLQDVLPQLPAKPGICSVDLLEGAVTPQMTNEQRIRGSDAGVDWALFVTGYREETLADLVPDVVGRLHFEQRGVTSVLDAMYGMDYSLTHVETNA